MNRLTNVLGAYTATLDYDTTGRLHQTLSGGDTTKFAYDGVDMITKYNQSNALTRRYIHGPGTDDPILWHEGSGTISLNLITHVHNRMYRDASYHFLIMACLACLKLNIF